jgi:hypothetical protein
MQPLQISTLVSLLFIALIVGAFIGHSITKEAYNQLQSKNFKEFNK